MRDKRGHKKCYSASGDKGTKYVRKPRKDTDHTTKMSVPNVADEWLTLLLPIWEVPGSNLLTGSGYPDCSFCFSLAPPGKFRNHHHHWLDSPMCALAFLRSFCQLKYPAIASSDFVTRFLSGVGLSVPHPNFGIIP
jgi:hypothetical protein